MESNSNYRSHFATFIDNNVVKLFSFGLFVATLIVAVTFVQNKQNYKSDASADMVDFTLAANTAKLNVGDTFFVDLFLANTHNYTVSAIDLVLDYPKDTLLVKETKVGEVYNQVFKEPTVSDGHIITTLGVLCLEESCNLQTASGTQLFRITFQAVKAGNATISLNSATTVSAIQNTNPVNVRGDSNEANISIEGTSTPTANIGDTVYGFDDITLPESGGSFAIEGSHSNIDFGNNQWASDDHMCGQSYQAAFAKDVKSGKFMLPAGKVLKSIRLCKATSTEKGSTADYSISDGINATKAGNVAYGSPIELTTNWTSSGTTITMDANWDLYIDNITYGDANSDGQTAPVVSTAVTYSFDDVTLPEGGGSYTIEGTHSNIDFGTGQWASDDHMCGQSYQAAFAIDIETGSFKIPDGKILKSIRLCKATDTEKGSTAEFSLNDGVNTKTGSVSFGNPIELITEWTKGGNTITLTANWDVYIDNITYDNVSN